MLVRDRPLAEVIDRRPKTKKFGVDSDPFYKRTQGGEALTSCACGSQRILILQTRRSATLGSSTRRLYFVRLARSRSRSRFPRGAVRPVRMAPPVELSKVLQLSRKATRLFVPLGELADLLRLATELR